MTDDMAPIFRALADPGRRVLLDRLFERDGQTLGELCVHLPEMTRFGVMKHLGVLGDANLVMSGNAAHSSPSVWPSRSKSRSRRRRRLGSERARNAGAIGSSLTQPNICD